MHRHDTYSALPEDVIAFAWSAPVRELAAKIGISDVGLRKLLNARGVATPPHGYWAKLRAGRKVPPVPKPGPRGPGENGRIRLDGRFRGHIPEASRMPANGPFASEKVPEVLEDLMEQELKAIGRVKVPRELGRAHRGLHRLLINDEKRRTKFAASGWDWDRPEHDNPFALRQLRIANTILKALSARGHGGEFSAGEDGYIVGAEIGNTWVELVIEREAKVRLISRELRELSAATPLVLRLQQGRKDADPKTWTDTKENRIEKQLGPVVAAMIVAGEARFRQSLVEAVRFEEQQKRWKEDARKQEIERLEKQRIADLKASGELLRQAAEIRELVERVTAAIEQGVIDSTPEELTAWTDWANGYADRIDPVLSGQVLMHIRVSNRPD